MLTSIVGFLKGQGREECCPALWDLVAALKWLKQNIVTFGGDPGRVTIVGHDTGAALVNLLMFSDLVEGMLLFDYQITS